MLINLLKTMRPRQWAKNGFLFAGLFFDRQLTNLPALIRTFAGFLLFCLLSGTIYIINDLADLEADRLHPRKKMRPLPSGKLSVRVAQWAIIILLSIIFPLAYWLAPEFAIFALLYFLLNLAYSFWIKHIPILDVLLLASFYVLRVGAGVTLIHVSRFSPWLYVFTTFLALFLGVGKRRTELTAIAANGANVQRRVLDGYTLPFLDQMNIIVSSMTIITYSLYTFSAPNLPDNHAMMLTIPFVIYGIFRYLYLIQVMQTGEAPEEVLFSDRPLQLTIFLWGISILSIFYLSM